MAAFLSLFGACGCVGVTEERVLRAYHGGYANPLDHQTGSYGDEWTDMVELRSPAFCETAPNGNEDCIQLTSSDDNYYDGNYYDIGDGWLDFIKVVINDPRFEDATGFSLSDAQVMHGSSCGLSPAEQYLFSRREAAHQGVADVCEFVKSLGFEVVRPAGKVAPEWDCSELGAAFYEYTSETYSGVYGARTYGLYGNDGMFSEQVAPACDEYTW